MTNCRDVDRLVTPYIDGEAPAEEQADVASHVGKCPPCRDRVEAETTAREILRARAEALRPQAPAGLVERCAAVSRNRHAPATASARVRRWMPLSLAATLVLAVAGAFAWGTFRPVHAIATQLTLDHLKCFAIAGDAARREEGDAARIELFLAKACGRAVPVPASAPALGLRLLSARRCRTTEGPVAHILYDHRGEPLSIFVLLDESRRGQNFEIMGHQALVWSGPGVTYAMIGHAPAAELQDVAAHARNAMAKATSVKQGDR